MLGLVLLLSLLLVVCLGAPAASFHNFKSQISIATITITTNRIATITINGIATITINRIATITITVGFHNFKSQNFKLSVSNPKIKYVAYVSVLSQFSNSQGLGRKNNFEILKTCRRGDARAPAQAVR